MINWEVQQQRPKEEELKSPKEWEMDTRLLRMLYYHSQVSSASRRMINAKWQRCAVTVPCFHDSVTPVFLAMPPWSKELPSTSSREEGGSTWWSGAGNPNVFTQNEPGRQYSSEGYNQHHPWPQKFSGLCSTTSLMPLPCMLSTTYNTLSEKQAIHPN